jgi:hypothetical protein
VTAQLSLWRNYKYNISGFGVFQALTHIGQFFFWAKINDLFFSHSPFSPYLLDWSKDTGNLNAGYTF